MKSYESLEIQRASFMSASNELTGMIIVPKTENTKYALIQ